MVIRWSHAEFRWVVQALVTEPQDRSAQSRHGVFIVEDHVGMRQALRRLMSRSSKLYVLGEAGSAEEALDALANEHPRVVTVDINLPGMSGLDLVRVLKQQHPEVRCVVVSAYSGLDRRRAALQAGAHGFVSKDEPSEIEGAVIEAAEMQGG